MAVIERYDADGTLIHREDTDPDGNEATLRQQAEAAMTVNRTFLALPAPTNAQTLAQVKALTRQVQALIRFELDDLTGTD